MAASRLFSVLGVAVAVFTGTAHPASPVDEPKRVEQKEPELQESQVASTLVRLRQARADGKTVVVIAEGRKLLRYYEANLKSVLEEATKGRLCSEWPLREAEGMVAVTRVWLAEAENKRQDLAAELPKVIAYHEWRIRSYQALHKNGLIPDEERDQEVRKSEIELERAKRRLLGFRSASSTPGKTENSAPGVPTARSAG
jgi:hypothetical protein